MTVVVLSSNRIREDVAHQNGCLNMPVFVVSSGGRQGLMGWLVCVVTLLSWGDSRVSGRLRGVSGAGGQAVHVQELPAVHVQE